MMKQQAIQKIIDSKKQVYCNGKKISYQKAYNNLGSDILNELFINSVVNPIEHTKQGLKEFKYELK